MGELIALPLSGSTVLPDARGEHRVLQVTWHPDDDVFVVSTWRAGQCVASTRLTPTNAAALISALSEGLARRP